MNFDVHWWLFFTAALLVLLLLDIAFMREISRKRAIRTTLSWITISLLFSGLLYVTKGGKTSLEYLTGYVIEQSLSIDNLFVFLLIFDYFKIPPRLQYRVLMWGILGALIMRFVFIFLGIALIQKAHWLLYLFGLFLVYTGVVMFKKEQKSYSPKESLSLSLLKRWLPVTDSWHGDKFFIRIKGVLHATPLFLVLVTIETTDLLFALDSIPAVFAITLDPFIVFSCNAMAILGLRSLYFVLHDLFRYFTLLHYGVCLILIFVGLKMLVAPFLIIPTLLSLAIVALIVGTSLVLSRWV